MDSANYELDLPRENIHIRCFAHNIMNYRYHWHADDYELSILLYGVQSYCRGSENSLLHEDDVILNCTRQRSCLHDAGSRYLRPCSAFFGRCIQAAGQKGRCVSVPVLPFHRCRPV